MRQHRDAPLRLEAVEAHTAEYVRCIFIRGEKSDVPVPLWKQYTVSWKGADLQQSKWIVVSNYEPWLMQMINAVTNKCVRRVGKAFTDLFRKEFQECVTKARAPHNAAADLSDSDGDGHEGSQPRWRAPGKGFGAVLDARIGGRQVRCLNHTTRMVLELDATTEEFITAWMVPLVRVLARQQDLPATVPPCVAPESSAQVAGFHFTASMTPNVRDKLCWNPLAHAWNLLLAKPKGAPTESFAVDASLPPKEFEEEKRAAYRRAIEAWNKLDGSSRLRIPGVPLIGGASGAIASG